MFKGTAKVIERTKRGLRRLAPGLARMASAHAPEWKAFFSYGWKRRRRTRPDLSAPIVVAGFHGAVLGLGEAARRLKSALEGVLPSVSAWDVSERLGHLRVIQVGETSPPIPGGGVLVAHMNPPELIHLIAQAGPAAFEGRYTIGYWAWELPRLPSAWRRAFHYVDEVWTPSSFTAAAVRAAAPRGFKVKVIPHPVPVTCAPSDRHRFGAAEGEVVVLCAFDFRSSLARKNPFAALAAFRLAKIETSVAARLIFKTVGAEQAPEAYEALIHAIGDARDVNLITASLSSEDRDALLASCDIFLSLHRAEGFGLLLAEAMAAGKSVIATGWSGNLDFMDATTSRLVDYRLVPVSDSQGLYEDDVWAEADVQHAAREMAVLMLCPEKRDALGQRAQKSIAEKLPYQRVASIISKTFGEP